MALARNVNKPVTTVVEFGSYPISVERRGRMLDADWYEPALTALGTVRGDRPALGATIRRNVSAQSRAASAHMFKAYVLNSVLNFLNQSQSYCESSCFFFIEKVLSSSKNSFPYTVFNGKHADNIGL